MSAAKTARSTKRSRKPQVTEVGVLAGAARSGAALVAELPSELYDAWSDSESEVLPMRGDVLYRLRTGRKPKPMSDDDNLRLACHEEVAFEAGLACGLAIARMGLSHQLLS